MNEKTSLYEVADRIDPVQAHCCQAEFFGKVHLDGAQFGGDVGVATHLGFCLAVSVQGFQQRFQPSHTVDSGQKSGGNTDVTQPGGREVVKLTKSAESTSWKCDQPAFDLRGQIVVVVTAFQNIRQSWHPHDEGSA